MTMQAGLCLTFTLIKHQARRLAEYQGSEGLRILKGFNGRQTVAGKQYYQLEKLKDNQVYFNQDSCNFFCWQRILNFNIYHLAKFSISVLGGTSPKML